VDEPYQPAASKRGACSTTKSKTQSEIKSVEPLHSPTLHSGIEWSSVAVLLGDTGSDMCSLCAPVWAAMTWKIQER
jgi:hypothetical protein